jgi:hypothetical protein
MSRWLIIFGVVLIAAGLLWLAGCPGTLLSSAKTFHFPIVTSLITSVILSLVLWLLNR